MVSKFYFEITFFYSPYLIIVFNSYKKCDLKKVLNSGTKKGFSGTVAQLFF